MSKALKMKTPFRILIKRSIGTGNIASQGDL
jgi:hypothetical protein